MLNWVLIILLLILAGITSYLLSTTKYENWCLDKRQQKHNRIVDSFEYIAAGLSMICFFFVVTSVWGTISTIQTQQTITKRIEYLQEYNAEIDEEIKSTVILYMDYEIDMFDREINALVLVNAYPELKANELINKQIEIYLKNKEEIKRLELAKIDNEFWQKVWYLW